MPCHLHPCEESGLHGLPAAAPVTFFHELFSCASRTENPFLHRPPSCMGRLRCEKGLPINSGGTPRRDYCNTLPSHLPEGAKIGGDTGAPAISPPCPRTCIADHGGVQRAPISISIKW